MDGWVSFLFLIISIKIFNKCYVPVYVCEFEGSFVNTYIKSKFETMCRLLRVYK